MNVSNDYSSIMVFRDRLEAAAASRLTEGPDADHWRSREFAERAAPKRATCTRAREVHQELAQAYARMAQNC